MHVIFKRPETRVEVVIATGALQKYTKKTAAIVTDSTVGPLYGKKLAAQTGAKIITIPAGEKSKTMQTAMTVAHKLLAAGVDRSSCIIGLGGGVVTDLTGFVASTLMRGIPFTLIPTSLLAMVDAALGGKTGVNLAEGKNLIGTFAQPQKIIIDPLVLKTLPQKEFENGLAESIKEGVIGDPLLFRLLSEKTALVHKRHQKTLTEIIKRSVQVKATIVTQDENEKGVRMHLNYGHTLGHAIERASNFKIPHGHGVSMGMCYANDCAVKKGLLSKKTADAIKQCLMAYNLPTEYKITPKMRNFLQYDKKKKRGKLQWILPLDIGKVTISE